MDYFSSLWERATSTGFAADAIVALSLVLLTLTYYAIRYIPFKQILPFFFKDKAGKRVAVGFFGAPIIIALIALVLFLLPRTGGAQGIVWDPIPGSFFNKATVFAGVDRTFGGTSPQCVQGGFNDRATSNMGVRLNVWEAPSRNLRLNLQYTHHSCAIQIDRNQYDGVGLNLEWDIWNSYK